MFTLRFETDNDAFQKRMLNESARILKEIALKLAHGHFEGKVLDLNGNTVGEWELTP